jgi:hypothetical protein
MICAQKMIALILCPANFSVFLATNLKIRDWMLDLDVILDRGMLRMLALPQPSIEEGFANLTLWTGADRSIRSHGIVAAEIRIIGPV